MQMSRETKDLPRLLLLNGQVKDIDGFTFDNINLLDYDAHPNIKGSIAV